MRIVVTGSAGRIGRYVVRDLVAAGHRVVGLDVLPGAEAGASHRLVDLTDAGQVYSALAGAEAVIHVGAWANAGIVPDTRTYADNVAGTFHVFQACADLGVRRVVSASSAQVYGFAARSPRYVPVDEDHPLQPLNCYALSKIAGEQAAAYFTDRHGLEILSFRFMGVRAPGEMLPQIEALNADPASGGGLLWTRTDARDAATACRLAVEAAVVEPGVYNLTGAEVVVDEDTASLMRRHWDTATEVRDGIPGHASPMTCARAARVLGYRPAYVWSASQQHPESET